MMEAPNYIQNGDYVQPFAYEPVAVNQQIELTEIGQTQSTSIQTTNAVDSYRPSSHLKRSFYNTLEDTTALYNLLDSWQLSDLFDHFERK